MRYFRESIESWFLQWSVDEETIVVWNNVRSFFGGRVIGLPYDKQMLEKISTVYSQKVIIDYCSLLTEWDNTHGLEKAWIDKKVSLQVTSWVRRDAESLYNHSDYNDKHTDQG